MPSECKAEVDLWEEVQNHEADLFKKEKKVK